jgi:hypothetical protein
MVGIKGIPMPTELRAKTTALKRSGQAAASGESDLILIVQFCVIGLLIMLIVMLSFPDLGALIEQYNQF